MLSAMFFCVYAFYGLGFCNLPFEMCMLILVGEGGRLIAEGDINTGTVLTVLFAIIIGAFSLGAVGPRVEAFAKAQSAAHSIFQTLARIPTIDSLSDTGDKPSGIKGNIEFKNVSFIYPARPEGS